MYPGYGVDPKAEINDSVRRLDSAISLLEKSKKAWEEHLQKLKAAKGARETDPGALLRTHREEFDMLVRDYLKRGYLNRAQAEDRALEALKDKYSRRPYPAR